MNRVAFLGLFVAVLLAGCSSPIQLNGTYSGDVYGNGYYLGAMAIDVTTSGNSFSGTGCFVGIDLSTACNTVNGTLNGSSVNFRIGGLKFTGTTDGTTINTTYTSDDGTISGHVEFSASSSQGLQVRSAPQTNGKLLAGLITQQLSLGSAAGPN